MKQAELEHALASRGFDPLGVLRWALRLARPLVRLNGTQSAAWDVVAAIVDAPPSPPVSPAEL